MRILFVTLGVLRLTRKFVGQQNDVHEAGLARAFGIEDQLSRLSDRNRYPAIELERMGMLNLTPRDVDQLFAEAPGLFAYTLPSIVERASLSVGDKVKLFFDVKGRLYPRAKWLLVSGKTEADEVRFTGRLSDGYGRELRAKFGEIDFGISHIYRLPLNRPESSNSQFDISLRDVCQTA